MTPGSDRPACGKCGRVRQWAEAQLRLAVEADAAAAAKRARVREACRWHDSAGWVLDPDTGLALEPAVRCDHRTPPREVKSRLTTRRPEPKPVASEESRRQALAEIARHTRRGAPHRRRGDLGQTG